MRNPSSESTAHNTDDSDGFINVPAQLAGASPLPEAQAQINDEKREEKFNEEWVAKASGKFSSPQLFGADALRQLYPKHSLVMTADWNINLLAFPDAYTVPLPDCQLVTNEFFVPLGKRLGSITGALVGHVEFGGFTLAWKDYEFILFIAKINEGFMQSMQHFILHDGPEEHGIALLNATGRFAHELHDEIWVFDLGMWQKDRNLWQEIQKADWKDVILKDDFKKALKKDVYGFFSSESVYRGLAIPWKRGLILYGPPGDGKTISVKAIMKTCDEKGYPPLYVKSFQGWMGEEASIASVFDKARQNSPALIILEDLDSLINDGNRSFFLNQLDGLGDNDGLLVIATTNHFERLDPGLSSRPSRFDRKYLFDDPDREERKHYAQYWQEKLKGTQGVDFPDSLLDTVADSTEGFSYAYLKEAFVATLVLMASWDDDQKPVFATILQQEIETLKKEVGKNGKTRAHPSVTGSTSMGDKRDIRALMDELSESISRSNIGYVRQENENQPRDTRSERGALAEYRGSRDAMGQNHMYRRQTEGRMFGNIPGSPRPPMPDSRTASQASMHLTPGDRRLTTKWGDFDFTSPGHRL